MKRTQSHRARAIAVSLLLATQMIWGNAASAKEFYWNGTGQDFADPASWDDGASGVPGHSDVALFKLSTFPGVKFYADQETDRALIRGGIVKFFGCGDPLTYTLLNPLATTEGLVVGLGGRDVTQLKVTGAMTLHTAFTTVGKLSDGIGTLGLWSDSALCVDHHLRVADEGIGTLQIYDATVSAGSCSIGNALFSSGHAEVAGELASFVCNGPLVVGKRGNGALTIGGPYYAADASLLCHDAVLAELDGATATVSVEDAAWTIEGSLDVGMNGSAHLDILTNAVVSNHLFATIGTYPHEEPWSPGEGVGDVFINDASWHVLGDLYDGYMSRGSLFVNGGSVIVDGDVHVGFSERAVGSLDVHDGSLIVGGSLSLGVDGAGSATVFGLAAIALGQDFLLGPIELGSALDYQTPVFNVAGDTADFNLSVSLTDPYQPKQGDAFAIVHADGALGQFTFELPPVADPLAWKIIATPHDITIVVASTAIPGDATGDGLVDVLDLLAVLNAWGDCPACPEDLTGDGLVDVLDLLQVLANWTTNP